MRLAEILLGQQVPPNAPQPLAGTEESRMGSDWALQSDWPFPFSWWLLLLFTSLTVLLLLEWRREAGNVQLHGLSSWKRWCLIGLRLLAVLIVLMMLGRWQLARYEVDLPDLWILIDRSQSMSMPLNNNESTTLGTSKTRLDAAKDVLTTKAGEQLRQLAEDYRLRVATVGETLNPLPGDVEAISNQLQDVQADAEASKLGVALVEAIQGQRGRSTVGIVLISDGVVTEGVSLQRAGEMAAAARLPVFAVKTGSENPPPNVAIEELLADSSAMVGDLVRVIARLRWESGNQSWKGQDRVVVRMRDEESGRLLSDKSISISSGQGSSQIEFMFTASDPGLRRLKIEVERVEGEMDLADNVAETSVDIRDDSFRILLVQGAASYEFRFLKHLLERATNRDGSRQLVDLVSVLQTGDPRYADQDRAARRLPPVDEQTLEQLDLIILSDCDPQGLGRVLQDRIVELVTGKGTSLIIIAGPNHLPGKLAGTPLESLLPVDPNSVRVPEAALQALSWKLTSLGNSVASLQISDTSDAWGRLPPIFWLARAGRLRPGARVFLETYESSSNRRLPILVSQLAGNGQVWLQLTDESFRMRAADVDAELYERYWLQTVRTLAQGRQVAGDDEASLEITGQRFYAGSAIPFEVKLGAQLTAIAGGQVTVSVSDEDGNSETFIGEVDSAGRGYRGLIQNLPAGKYRAVLASPTGSADPANDAFIVEEENLELAETTIDLTSLENVGRASGGALLDIAEFERLSEIVPKGRALRVRSLEPIIVWNHWSIACVLFGLLMVHWILRHRFGGL